MNTTWADAWRELHRFCTDDPSPIRNLDHARVVLDDHEGHDDKCNQLLAALQHVSANVS